MMLYFPSSLQLLSNTYSYILSIILHTVIYVWCQLLVPALGAVGNEVESEAVEVCLTFKEEIRVCILSLMCN